MSVAPLFFSQYGRHLEGTFLEALKSAFTKGTLKKNVSLSYGKKLQIITEFGEHIVDASRTLEHQNS